MLEDPTTQYDFGPPIRDPKEDSSNQPGPAEATQGTQASRTCDNNWGLSMYLASVILTSVFPLRKHVSEQFRWQAGDRNTESPCTQMGLSAHMDQGVTAARDKNLP